MGLKTTNYELKSFGITIPEAYARLTDISINVNGWATGTFKIHQTREDLAISIPLEKKYIEVFINKDLPIYTQIYNASKEKIFVGWEDDIVENIEITEEDIVESIEITE